MSVYISKAAILTAVGEQITVYSISHACHYDKAKFWLFRNIYL